MYKKHKEEILNLYETLIENGVVFYYGSEVIPTGEITSFDINDEGIINIEVDGFETYEITLDEFQECHSKEGANYHNWPDIRKFDLKIQEINN
ncbi:hypothetical protein ACH36K_02290 [Clostridium sp. MB05]|uniref:hypothetical protein n=1 Tax=Clostridium sp. MB05 TaxID=3376682 RepID=UPI0039824A7C